MSSTPAVMRLGYPYAWPLRFLRRDRSVGEGHTAESAPWWWKTSRGERYTYPLKD
jgi:hypothetical protein